MATSNSLSTRISCCKDGRAVVAAVTLLERDGVVRRPAVQLLSVEVTVEVLRARVRERM